jgi:hypothetical protein
MSIGTGIYDRALAATDDLIGRIARAQRMSGVKESGSLKSIRDEYRNVSAPGGQRYAEAHEILTRFVRVAQDYYERARNNVAYIKQWTRYEDQKLRKPIARLVRLQSESRRWEALRRLQSPSGPIQFIQLPNGEQVKISTVGEFPRFDTITLASLSPGSGSDAASPR